MFLIHFKYLSSLKTSINLSPLFPLTSLLLFLIQDQIIRFHLMRSYPPVKLSATPLFTVSRWSCHIVVITQNILTFCLKQFQSIWKSTFTWTAKLLIMIWSLCVDSKCGQGPRFNDESVGESKEKDLPTCKLVGLIRVLQMSHCQNCGLWRWYLR